MIGNRDNGTIPREDPDGTVNWISYRSEAIITYALCGFANIGSIGIVLGGLGNCYYCDGNCNIEFTKNYCVRQHVPGKTTGYGENSHASFDLWNLC